MEKFSGNKPYIIIKEAKKEDLPDLILCANEFIELIDQFKINFLNNKYLSFITYYNNVVVGVLIAEEMVKIQDSIENLLPKTLLKLIYVNPKYRNKRIGAKLLFFFLRDQKQKGIASVYVMLPQKYKHGIKFFEINNFCKIGKKKDKILLEFSLWEDFGLRFSRYLSDDLNHILD